MERCTEILDEAAGDPLIEAGTLRSLSSLEARRGRFDEARELVRRARALFGDVGSSGLARLSTAFAAADIELLVEDYAAAERELRPWLAGLEQMGERGYRSSLVAWIAQALYGQGRHEEAEQLTIEAQESASASDIWTQATACGTRAKVLAARGEAEQAELLARRAVDLVEPSDSLDLRGGALADLAEVLLAGGDAEGERRAEEAAGLFESKGNVAAVRRLEGALRRSASAR